MNVPTAVAANGSSYLNGTVRTNAALNVGGRAVAVPAAARMASNAGRVAAAAVMLHPALRTAASVAAWLGAGAFLYDAASGLWKSPDPNAQPSDGYIYSYSAAFSPVAYSYSEACRKFQDYQNSASSGLFIGSSVSGTNCVLTGNPEKNNNQPWTYSAPLYKRADGSCPTGWYVTPAGCVQTPPMKSVTEQEFVDGVSANPMPANVPLEIPHPLPIEIPEIVPLFIPTGDPVPNPNYNPSAPPSPENQPFVQPGINVQPAPSPSSPWQVDLQPVNRPVANPKPGSDPVPNTNPDGTPKPNPGDKPREEQEQDKQDFCDKHPDVIACQKLDAPEDPGKLPTKAVELDFQVESGYGGAAACPPPMVAVIGGRTLSISWQPFCNSLEMAKNLLLAFAWLSAAFILLGAKKE
ncbi:virulence factor TspB C-terminal domain-related protein [Comamonas sp. lk]|uniref:virulence factor TspB C-terminal domain-related protein n=1 Tax=Comamonas sp. lk TaxID=2201272 RepID=UPI000EB0E92A|nr:virulence factor TspB C-terminal domain-related protein [Comamonas sp. lk]